MRKALKWGLRLGVGLLALVLFGLFAAFDGVDYRPYFDSAYYRETRTRLIAQEANLTVARGNLDAGFGKARLTPTLNATQDDPASGRFKSLPLAGYGNRHGKPATGVHDDLYAKAIAFRVGEQLGVIVSADALIIPREVSAEAAEALRRDLGLRREQILFGATHTHAGLGGWGEGMVAEAFAGPYQPGVRIWLARQLANAAREAVANLAPASWGQDRFAAPEFIRNRLVGNRGRVDPEFDFGVVKRADGRMAVLGVYGAHATVLPSSLMEYSADYPGYWAHAVERATGGMAMFLAGGIGSHSPAPGGNGFAGAQHMGESLADAVIQRISTVALTNRIAFGLLGLEVELPPLHVRVTDGWRLRPALARRLLPVAPRTWLQAFRLNDLIWIAAPCDFSGELALGIKDDLRARGLAATITSFNGDYVGYVIPARYYHLGGYEPRTMSFFGPYMGDYFDELIRTLGTDLAQR